jgi:hypothetical protein
VSFRGWPGRGSSCRPSRPRFAKRPRQRPTVCVLQPRRVAISLLCSPRLPPARSGSAGPGLGHWLAVAPSAPEPRGPPRSASRSHVGASALPSSLAMATTSTAWGLCLRSNDSGHWARSLVSFKRQASLDALTTAQGGLEQARVAWPVITMG